MTHLAATATTAGCLAGLALAAALGYAAACAVAPYRPCRACSGTGQRRSWLGYTRPCPRLRWGRRAYNHLHRIHHRGTRQPTKPGSGG